MVWALGIDLCYLLHNAHKPMTDPKNTEDQELSLDELKDAAGGAAFIGGAAFKKLGDIKGESFHSNAAGDPLPTEEILDNDDTLPFKFELDKSSTKYNPGKGASGTDGYYPGGGGGGGR